MSTPAGRLADLDDLLALEAEGRRGEILAGELVEKAGPSFEHGAAQGSLMGALWGSFDAKGGGDRPGGWWFATETGIRFEPHQILRPDVAGWRRDRVPERPAGLPVEIAPDWVCEILSPSTASRDLGPKADVYHRHGVGHYWVVDLEHGVLSVLRRAPEGWLLVRTAADGPAQLEPFEAITIEVGRFFGREP